MVGYDFQGSMKCVGRPSGVATGTENVILLRLACVSLESHESLLRATRRVLTECVANQILEKGSQCANKLGMFSSSA